MADREVLVKYVAEVQGFLDNITLMIEQNEEFSDSALETAKVIGEINKEVENLTKDTKNNVDERTKAIDKEIKRLELLKKAYAEANDPQSQRLLQREIDNTSKAIRGLEGSAKKGANILKGLGGILAGLFATDFIIKFSQLSIQAFQKVEKSAKDLAFAVREINFESEDALASLQRQAEELSGATKSVFTQENIQDVQTQLAQYGILSDEIRQLVPLILDYASAQDIELSQATKNVISAIDGQGRALREVGIRVDKTSTEYERYNQLLVDLAKFTGKAEEATETFEGQQTQASKRILELSESIGETLIPILQKVQLFFLEAGQGIIDAFKIFGEAGRTELTFKGFAKFGGLENAREIGEGLQELGFTVSDLDKQNENLAVSLGDTLINLQNNNQSAIDNAKSLDDLNAQYNSLLQTRDRVVELGKEEAISDENAKTAKRLIFNELVKVQEAIDGFADSTEKALTKQDVQGKSLEELNALLEQYKNVNTSIARSNVQRIEEQIEAIKRLGKTSTEVNNQRLKELQEIARVESSLFSQFEKEEEKRRKAFQDTFTQRIQIVQETEGTGPALIAGESELLANFQEQQKAIDAFTSTFEDSAQGQLVNTALKKKAEEDYVNAIKKLYEELGLVYRDNSEAIAKSTQEDAEARERGLRAIVDATADLFAELNALSQQQTQSRIDDLDRQQEAFLENLNVEREALEEQRENRLISEQAFQEKLADIDKREVALQEQIRKEKNEILRKQAIADKANAVFQIGINIEQGITRALASLNAPFSFIVAGLIGALGAVSLANVLSTPVPQFAKGTKGKEDSGLALVGEEGPEMTFLPKGAKVLPNEQTQRYSDVFDAMYDNKYDDYIMKNHVAPALLQQRKAFDQKKDETFANNIVNNLKYQGITFYDLEDSRKKGQNINNTKELARAIAKEMSVNTRRL